MRKVLEYVFRTANDYGLLPDRCINNQGYIRLSASADFIDKNPIFTQDIAACVTNVLKFSNSNSHTNKDESYGIKDEIKELFFSYVLQLSHIIKWFGKYIEEHSEKEVNRKKTQRIG